MNTDKDFGIARQGSLDGLCGIYSIINYFVRLADVNAEKARELSRRMFKSALLALESNDKLTAHNLAAGFWPGQLRQIADAVALKHAIKVESRGLAAYAEQKRHTDPLEVVQSLNGQGAVILNLRRPGHWVLAYATPSGTLRYDDPATGKTSKLSDKLVAKRSVKLKKGLVLLHA